MKAVGAFDNHRNSNKDSVWTGNNIHVMGRDMKGQASEKTLKFSESEVFVAASEDMNI